MSTTTEDYQRYLLKKTIHLNVAHEYAQLSRARRLKVGCVIVKDDRIISVGYNGTPAGRDNDCEYIEELPNGGQLKTKPEVLHAESNALMYALREGVSTVGCELFTTHSPCYDCCKLIVSSGITIVYYDEEYRDTSGIDFLEECGITVLQKED